MPAAGSEERSPLAAARLRRKLGVEEVARRAGLTQEEVVWLEEGRVYRFASGDAALLAAVAYTTALRIGRREARELVGAPLPPRRLDGKRRRLAAVAILAAVAGAIAGAIASAGSGGSGAPVRAAVAGPALPPPWRIRVDVLNGAGDINHTRRIATRVGVLAYRVERVARATRFDYPRTAVYYEPGGAAIAIRLARSLGVATSPLPGGSDPRRLVVIVGPARGPG